MVVLRVTLATRGFFANLSRRSPPARCGGRTLFERRDLTPARWTKAVGPTAPTALNGLSPSPVPPGTVFISAFTPIPFTFSIKPYKNVDNMSY